MVEKGLSSVVAAKKCRIFDGSDLAFAKDGTYDSTWTRDYRTLLCASLVKMALLSELAMGGHLSVVDGEVVGCWSALG